MADLFAAPKKVKIQALLAAEGAITWISRQSVPAEQAKQILDLLQWARPKILKFFDERLRIAKNYGKNAENKGEPERVVVPPERMAEFNKEIEPIQAVEIDMPESVQLPYSTLKGITLTALELEALRPLMRE